MSDTFTLEKAPERGDGPEILPEDSQVPAVVKWVEREKMPYQDRETGEDVYKVKWVFELKGPEYKYVGHDGDMVQRRVYGQTSTVFNDSPMCRLRAWVTEVLSADQLPPGFQLRLPDLVGNECVVVLEINEWYDKKAPQSTWTEDPVTGELKPPKRRNNRVKDVLRTPTNAGSAGGGSFTLDDVATGNQPQADTSAFDEEPF